MAWIGSPLDNISLFDAPMLEDEEEGDQWKYSAYDDYSPAFDASDSLLHSLTQCSLPPVSSITSNMNVLLSDFTTFDEPDSCLSPEASRCNVGGDANLLDGQKRVGAKGEFYGTNVGNSADDENDKHINGFGKVGKNSDGYVGTGVTDNKGAKNSNGLPAKNLMAERRRRKKLNDRLFMLRSVVPKISKTDRISIVGDAAEYLKELMQRINELSNELMQSSETYCLLGNRSKFQPSTNKHPVFLDRVREEYHFALPNPDVQPVKVEVREIADRAFNIQMACSRKPGLLLSTMRCLDALGLDVKQAVFSCFTGFALNVFQAEQCLGKGIPTEDIKALLLHAAGYQTRVYQTQPTTR